MKTNSLVAGIVVFAIAGTVTPVSAQTQDAIQANRYLGDRWSVRLFGNLSEFESRIKIDLRQSSLTMNASLVF